MAQQFVIMARDNAHAGGALMPIGERSAVLRSLASINTGPQKDGEDILYGPGIRVEVPPGQDPLTQMLLTVTEEDIAWPVMLRLARTLDVKILDPGTGRELNASA